MARDDLEEIVSRHVNGRDERSKVVEVVQRCLKKGYDYDEMKSRVSSIIADSYRANKFLSAVTAEFPQLRKRTRTFEESHNNGRDRDRDRDRDRGRDERRDRERERREREREERLAREKEKKEKELQMEERKKLALEILEKSTKSMDMREKPPPVKKEEPIPDDPATFEEQLRAKELMYKAQAEIEERKRQLNLRSTPAAAPTTSGKLTLKPQEASLFINHSMEKKSRVEELKAKLAKASPALAGAAARAANIPVPPPKPPPEPEIVKEEPKFLDPRLSQRSAQRQRRTFNFHEKGEFEQLANKQRAKAKLEKLQAEISQAAKATGISSAVKLAMVTPSVHASEAAVPDIEWWDSVVVRSYDDISDEKDSQRYANIISDLIEHPIQLKPPNEPVQAQYLRVYLTKKERKKIRRQNRKEAEKEKTEKIRLGLMKPPEPKVKLSNLMRVLGNDAIQDPTKMEAHVRKQMAERLRKHEEANAARKLTAAEAAAKKTRKIHEDTSLAVHVALYRVKSLIHPAKKFKVEMNAKQLQMTGVIIIHKDINLVIVEGGPKQQKFYKNLMLNRIKWNEEIIGEKKAAVDKDTPGERNECRLLWEGIVKKRNFGDIKCVTATLEKQARELLEKHGCAHYFDLAYSTTILLDTNPDIL